MAWKTKELWIGDYSILIHLPENATADQEREIIKRHFYAALAEFGLKIVDA